jgi:ActR/RegA family two-component response regulator
MTPAGKLPELPNSLPRILIVDNDKGTTKIFSELVSHWGFVPVLAEGEGISLVEDARKKARDLRCQLALIDMRLIDNSDDDDISGLNLINQIKPAVSIVVTGHGSANLAIKSIHEKGAANFVGKEDGAIALKEKIQREAAKIVARGRPIKIVPDEILTTIGSILFDVSTPTQYHDQIVDILARLFPDAHYLHLKKMFTSELNTGFSTAPRPRSIVLRVYEDDLQPVIVKFARRHKITTEVERFKKYIDGRLVGGFKPTLSGYVELWDIGGIKLSYVGNIVETFTHFFKTQPFENIEKSLERFFSYTWSAHYQKTRQETDVSLFKLYCSVWGIEWVERAEKLRNTNPNDAMGHSHWRKTGAKDPLQWLLEDIVKDKIRDASIISNVSIAVTHGDLHADNIIIDDSNNAWVLDFERSGEGHALQDFIELESDIINRIAGLSDDFQTFYHLCILLTSMEELGSNITPVHPSLLSNDVQKVIRTIATIRRLAHKCTGVTDAREYLFGLFFNTIFRATITKAQEKSQQRALMLAGILCHRLEHWDDTWPPDVWDELQFS